MIDPVSPSDFRGLRPVVIRPKIAADCEKRRAVLESLAPAQSPPVVDGSPEVKVLIRNGLVHVQGKALW